MSPSRVLAEVDPIQFRCAVGDYADGQDWTEIEGDTYENRDLEAARESFADIKREEITEKESEALVLSDEIGDEEQTPSQMVEMTRLRAELATLEAEHKEIEEYTF